MNRDNRDYDLTRMNLKRAKDNLNRDYSASFFRYSFARKFFSIHDNILEIGCGYNTPLARLIKSHSYQLVNTYTGVDMCPLEELHSNNIFLRGEFNFVERWKELANIKYETIIRLEVIEHMRVEFGTKLLKACRELIEPDGIMLFSTPIWNGKTQSPNHVHEYTIIELEALVKSVGFKVHERFGTQINIRTLKQHFDIPKAMLKYFDNNALSCIFAPMFPELSKCVFWTCKPI